MKTLLLQCDGTLGARQGPAGVGVILRELNGRIVRWQMALVPAQTCNEAEYQALIVGLRLAQQQAGPCAVICMTDSQIIVDHMAGRCRVRSAGLHPFHAQACVLVTQLASVRFVHIPRTVNRLADALAWEALGGTAALLRAVS